MVILANSIILLLVVPSSAGDLIAESIPREGSKSTIASIH